MTEGADSDRGPSSDGNPSGSEFDANGSSWIVSSALTLFLLRFFLPAESAYAGETSVLAAAWLGLASLIAYLDWRSGRSLFYGVADIAIIALVGPMCIAGLTSEAMELNHRVSRNLTLEWLSLGVSLMVLRRCTDFPGFRRVFSATLVSVLVAIAAYGVWQHFVWYPSLSAELEEFERLEKLEAPSAIELAQLKRLRSQLGPQYLGADAADRESLKNRLVGSREPLGFFALANTLGGLLAAGLLFAGFSIWPKQRARQFVRACFLVLLLITFLLTKSRTAVVGLGCGVILGIALYYGRAIPWKRVVVGGAIFCCLVGLLAIVGGLDLEILTESSKSLAYRIEYWRATSSMLAEHWLSGVGLGNFRPVYLAYKLPGASEEILDPHNWVLESWTTAGIIGVCGAMAAIAGLLIQCVRTAVGRVDESIETAGRPLTPVLGATALALIWSGFPIVIEPSVICVGGVAAAVVGIGQWTWSQRGGAVAATAAAVAVSVHLLGSGGFGMPAVMQVWLASLVVYLFNDRRRSFRPGSAAVVASVMAACLIASLLFVVRPNVARDRWMAEAEARTQLSGDMVGARTALQRAADADPLSPDPWIQLAALHASAGDSSKAAEAIGKAVAASPRSPTLRKWAADLADSIGESELAVALIREAVQGYPNGADVRATAAELLTQQSVDEAAAMARAALALDDRNRNAGHSDLMFSEERRTRLARIAAGTEAAL